MIKITNTDAYRYSSFAPEFYRFNGKRAPRGIGCGLIAEDAGLWNLAWLSSAQPFTPYEQFLEDNRLTIWNDVWEEFISALGDVVINGDKLQAWAAKLPAKELMKLVADFSPTAKYPLKDGSWASWAAYANFRARSSTAAVVDAAEFEPAKDYVTLAEAARRAEVIVRALPKPGLPIFPKTRRCKTKSIEACLAQCIRNASSQGANSNV